MGETSERDPLLASSKNDRDSVEQSTYVTNKVKLPSITVEPVIILGTYCATAAVPLLEQFGYAKLAAEANISTITTEEQNSCNVNQSDPIYEKQQEIQAQTADFFQIIFLLQVIPNVVAVPVLVYLSDLFGRKPILVACMSSMFVGYAFWMISVYFDQPLSMLYIGAVAIGLFGSFTYQTVAMAYLADTSKKSDRSFKMVVYEFSVAIACVFSNITTGFLIKYVDIVYPFLSLVVCIFIALVYIIFFLPESLDKAERLKRQQLRRNCIAPYKDAFSILFKDDGTNRRWKIQLLVLLNTVISANHAGFLIVIPLYLLNSPLCFDSVAIGVVIVEIYFFRALATLGLSRVFKHVLSDTSMIIMSLLSDICIFVIFGLLPYPVWIFFAPIPGMAGLMSQGYCKGLASTFMKPEEQGAFFAGNSVVTTITVAIGSSVYNLIYRSSLDFYKGSAFLAVAIVTVILLFCVIPLHISMKSRSNALSQGETSFEPETETSIHLSTEVQA